MAADPEHYQGFQKQMKDLVKSGYNAASKDIMPKLGSGLFELKGKKPLLVRDFKFCKMKCIAVAWAPASDSIALSSRIVCGDQSGQVLIVDAKKGTRKGGYNLSGPSRFVQAVAIHAKKDLIVSGGMDNMISLYAENEDPNSPFLMCKKTWANPDDKPAMGHDGMISSLRWHPEVEDQFISAGGDGEIKLWDQAKTECITTFYGHSQEATSITMPKDVPGGQTFATCSNDTTVRLWDLRQNGKCVLALHAEKPEDKLASCDFFPNGNAICSGGQGQKTYMWDIRAVKLVAGFTRNNMKVTGCSFSKSGRAIYVTHEDGRLIVWDTFGAQENQKYAIKLDAHFISSDKNNPKAGAASESQITFCGLKPDGEFLATAAFSGDLKIWGGLQAGA